MKPPLIRQYTNFWPLTDLDLITEFDFLPKVPLRSFRLRPSVHGENVEI